MLLNIIGKHLGTAPEAVRARAIGAAPALLDSWADALLDAERADADSIDAILQG